MPTFLCFLAHEVDRGNSPSPPIKLVIFWAFDVSKLYSNFWCSLLDAIFQTKGLFYEYLLSFMIDGVRYCFWTQWSFWTSEVWLTQLQHWTHPIRLSTIYMQLSLSDFEEMVCHLSKFEKLSFRIFHFKTLCSALKTTYNLHELTSSIKYYHCHKWIFAQQYPSAIHVQCLAQPRYTRELMR